MIRALILDIDGIILGHNNQINFPSPTKAVQLHLQNLAKKMPVSLCTVKAYFAVKPIVDACGLQNSFHITDAGATIVQSSTNTATTTAIEEDVVMSIVEDLRRENIFTEWYTDNGYYELKHENALISEGRKKLFGRDATIVTGPTGNCISKIIALPMNEWQETSVIDIAKKYTKAASLHWGINPSLIPRMAAFFTNPSATKESGAEKISTLTKIPLSETLAMGDSINDWTFMKNCGYVGTIGNGANELKKLVTGRREFGYVSEKTVDEDGVLEVLKHFGL